MPVFKTRSISAIFTFSLIASLHAFPAFGLDSDSQQPATLEADDFTIDLNTGTRVYRGNVVYVQGSIRLKCSELSTYFNDEGALDKAICIGSPGHFKQRPEGETDDIHGEALKITFDQKSENVELKNRAKVLQGTQVLTGRLINYDLATEKVKVTSGGQKTQKSSGSDSSTQSNQPAARPKIIIKPRTQPAS